MRRPASGKGRLGTSARRVRLEYPRLSEHRPCLLRRLGRGRSRPGGGDPSGRGWRAVRLDLRRSETGLRPACGGAGGPRRDARGQGGRTHGTAPGGACGASGGDEAGRGVGPALHAVRVGCAALPPCRLRGAGGDRRDRGAGPCHVALAGPARTGGRRHHRRRRRAGSGLRRDRLDARARLRAGPHRCRGCRLPDLYLRDDGRPEGRSARAPVPLRPPAVPRAVAGLVPSTRRCRLDASRLGVDRRADGHGAALPVLRRAAHQPPVRENSTPTRRCA